MENLIILVVVVIIGLILTLAIIIFLGFGLIQIHLLEKILKKEDENYPTDIFNLPKYDSTDQITPDEEDSTVPLEQFTPNFGKKTKIIFTQDENSHGLEEVEEGDTI